MVAGTPTQSNMRPVVYLVIINLIFMAFAFGGQYFTANRRPAAREEPAHTQIGKKSIPQVPLPYADKK
jgi:hypothetical protein